MDKKVNKLKKPPWLSIRLKTNRNYNQLESLIKEKSIHTVCQEAKCPNVHECWSRYKTASFMVLGDICTRYCRFCAVKTGLPKNVDDLEPHRVAEAVRVMNLSHAVITMVNRDDLRDGGAKILAATVKHIHKINPHCTVEILSSDLMLNKENIKTIVQSQPEIIGHNLETVERLTPQVRSKSTYKGSLDFLQSVKDEDPNSITKSSLMLGLGETKEEILMAMDHLRNCGVSLINLGQYLQPTKKHFPVKKFWKPEEFLELRDLALGKGFIHCESGPLVRSSYHAGEQFQLYRRQLKINNTE